MPTDLLLFSVQNDPVVNTQDLDPRVLDNLQKLLNSLAGADEAAKNGNIAEFSAILENALTPLKEAQLYNEDPSLGYFLLNIEVEIYSVQSELESAGGDADASANAVNGFLSGIRGFLTTFFGGLSGIPKALLDAVSIFLKGDIGGVKKGVEDLGSGFSNGKLVEAAGNVIKDVAVGKLTGLRGALSRLGL